MIDPDLEKILNTINTGKAKAPAPIARTLGQIFGFNTPRLTRIDHTITKMRPINKKTTDSISL